MEECSGTEHLRPKADGSAFMARIQPRMTTAHLTECKSNSDALGTTSALEYPSFERSARGDIQSYDTGAKCYPHDQRCVPSLSTYNCQSDDPDRNANSQ